jgi:peptidoglycan L-alanyl-D-glutamate endopeptidase CwlK
MTTLKEIQQRLNKLGYGPLVEDGKRGPKTIAAIKAFQTAHKITPDGLVGGNTLKWLFPPVVTVVVPANNTFQDKATLDRIKLLHPKLREEGLAIYNEINTNLTGRVKVRFSYTLRTFAEQASLFNQGRTKSGPVVTNARAGQSYHNYGLAIDIVLLIDKDGNGTYETASWDTIGDYDGDRVADWMEAVKVFEKYGWEWGGRWVKFKDQPHFQKVFGKSISQLQALRAAGKMTDTFYPNI